jgi:CDP-diacylglycerol--glycerol-3-phosphate 3-phosphatidyltransferase
MNWPNKISILRILLAPAIVASLLYYHPEREWLRFLALGLFTVGVASDAVDGFLARLQHQQTELGTLLDPIADKTLILSTLISCAVIKGLPAWMRIPAWFNLIVISRDALLVAGTVVLFVIKGRWSVHPSRVGKATTFAQMLVIPSVLLGIPPAVTIPLLAAAAALTVCSAISYVRMGIRALS